MLSIFCLSVCLFVRLYPINVKTAEPIGAKFRTGPHITPGKITGRSKLQKLLSKIFDFCKILKMREKVLLNPRTFLLLLSFILYKEKMLTHRATIKSWKKRWWGAKRPKSLLLCLMYVIYCMHWIIKYIVTNKKRININYIDIFMSLIVQSFRHFEAQSLRQNQ